MTHLYITSATGALRSDVTPVGGGVAVLEALLPQLDADGVPYTLLTPAEIEVPSLRNAPVERLLELGERDYARFALEWEAALTRFFADAPAKGAVVLTNDISEGPPFRFLRERGFRQIALFHVVVAEFFSRRYLQERLRLPLDAARAAALWRAAERLGLAKLGPDIARLVWAKEGAAACYADALVVPSAPLTDSLAACYPAARTEERTHVVKWGVIGEPDPSLRGRRADTLAAVGADRNRFQLLTLSRISPEKRLELLLDALQLIERQSPDNAHRLELTIAGAPAYMGGQAYLRQLRRRAARLHEIPVHFIGYAPPPLKWELLAAADLFVSPSLYEAYGLTIAQALGSGTPVLAANHEGARAALSPETGWVVRGHPSHLSGAIRRALAAAETGRLLPMREAAAQWGCTHRFNAAASRIIELIHRMGA